MKKEKFEGIKKQLNEMHSIYYYVLVSASSTQEDYIEYYVDIDEAMKDLERYSDIYLTKSEKARGEYYQIEMYNINDCIYDDFGRYININLIDIIYDTMMYDSKKEQERNIDIDD